MRIALGRSFPRRPKLSAVVITKITFAIWGNLGWVRRKRLLLLYATE